MSRLHPIPYGTGIILVPDWMQPGPRRARREARASQGVSAVDSRRETFSTGRGRLKVRNPAGDVRIETADTDETTVELTALNDSDATRQAIANASLRARGGEVEVEIEGRSWSISIGNWGITLAEGGVRITCPHGTDLECRDGVRRRQGPWLGSATHACGQPPATSRLDHVGGSLELKTASGDARVERVEGRAAVNTVSGDVNVGTALAGLTVDVGLGGRRDRGGVGRPDRLHGLRRPDRPRGRAW